MIIVSYFTNSTHNTIIPDLKMDSHDLHCVLKMLEIKADNIFRFGANLNEFIPAISIGAFKRPISLLSVLRQV